MNFFDRHDCISGAYLFFLLLLLSLLSFLSHFQFIPSVCGHPHEIENFFYSKYICSTISMNHICASELHIIRIRVVLDDQMRVLWKVIGEIRWPPNLANWMIRSNRFYDISLLSQWTYTIESTLYYSSQYNFNFPAFVTLIASQFLCEYYDIRAVVVCTYRA